MRGVVVTLLVTLVAAKDQAPVDAEIPPSFHLALKKLEQAPHSSYLQQGPKTYNAEVDNDESWNDHYRPTGTEVVDPEFAPFLKKGYALYPAPEPGAPKAVRKKYCPQGNYVPKSVKRSLRCSFWDIFGEGEGHKERQEEQQQGKNGWAAAANSVVVGGAGAHETVQTPFGAVINNPLPLPGAGAGAITAEQEVAAYERGATTPAPSPWHTKEVDKLAAGRKGETRIPDKAQPYKARQASTDEGSAGSDMMKKLAKINKKKETEVPLEAQPYKARPAPGGDKGKEILGKMAKAAKKETVVPLEAQPYKARGGGGGGDTSGTLGKLGKLMPKEEPVPIEAQPYKAWGPR